MISLLYAAILVSELAVGVSASADIVTTELALNRGAFTEANPFMRGGTGARVASKALVATAVVMCSRHLRKKGHKNAAKVLCWTAAGIWLGASAWNLRQLHNR